MTAAAKLAGCLQARLDGVVAARRLWLEAEYGYAGLEIDCHIDVDAKSVEVVGSVLGWHERERLASALSEATPPGWSVDVGGLRQRRSGDWRSLQSDAWIWRERSVIPDRTPSSELVPVDGPLEVLAIEHGEALVRTRSRLMGWTSAGLGRPRNPTDARPSAAGAAEAVAIARSYVGVPYRMGGTTRAGVDCSGLVFRMMQQAFGAAAPRHSTDLVKPERVPSGGHRQPGDVVLVTPTAKIPHVGVVEQSAGGAMRIVHASSTAGRVVVEDLEAFLDGEPMAGVATLDQLLERCAL